MKKQMFSPNKKIVKIWFAIILMETLQINKAVIATSQVTISYDTKTSNSDLESKDIFLNNEKEQNNRERIVDRVKDLEMQFQLHVSTSNSKFEEQYEQMMILKAARKTQDGKLQLVLNEMEVLKAKNRDQTARIEQLEEILKIKSDTVSSIDSVTTKPNSDVGPIIPSSCEDLKSNGHHLNGIYMIYDVNVKKILATFCDFHPFSEKAIGNRVIGSVGINTLVGGIYFYAQMKNTFREAGKSVPFDRILVNQGNGLSPTNQGVFTAPRAGIYHFTFKGNNWGGVLGPYFNQKNLIIEIHHNGVAVGCSSTIVGLLHVHATLKLKAGDRVYIFKASGGSLYTDLKTPHTHFSGWLLEEDVSNI